MFWQKVRCNRSTKCLKSYVRSPHVTSQSTWQRTWTELKHVRLQSLNHLDLYTEPKLSLRSLKDQSSSSEQFHSFTPAKAHQGIRNQQFLQVLWKQSLLCCSQSRPRRQESYQRCPSPCLLSVFWKLISVPSLDRNRWKLRASTSILKMSLRHT